MSSVRCAAFAAIVGVVLFGVSPSLARLVYSPTRSTEFSDPPDALPPWMQFSIPAGAPPGQSYGVGAGWLTMTTTGHTDMIFGEDTVPKVLEAFRTADFDFALQTRVQAVTDVYYEHAGILIYRDSLHWMRLICEPTDNISLQEHWAEGFRRTDVSLPGADFVLRLEHAAGGAYQGWASLDGGASFVLVGAYGSHGWTNDYIGLTVCSTPPGNVFDASFDYFRVWIPEPATLGLLALGGLAVLRRRRAAKRIR